MSASTLAAMVVRVLAREGRTFSVVKFSNSTPTDSTKPWNGATAQQVASTLTVTGMIQPALGRGFGAIFKKDELTSDIEEMIVFQPPTTGEDLSTYHVVTDGSIQKKVWKWHVVKPASQVIAYIAGIKK